MSGFHDPFLDLMPTSPTSPTGPAKAPIPERPPSGVPAPAVASAVSGDSGPSKLPPSPVVVPVASAEESVKGAAFRALDKSFAAADPINAGELLCLIPTEVDLKGGLSLASEMRGSLRAEVRQWVDGLRKRNDSAAVELRSLSPRDEAIDILMTRVIQKASQSATGVWTAALPTGRQLALVRQDVLSAVGIDQLVRSIHHFAIKTAMANGDPYSSSALASYEVGHPDMSASGAR